jgi:hypothetical protein
LHVLVARPPLKATLTLPAGRGPFPGVVMLSGSGPTDQDLSAGPNKPFRDIELGLELKASSPEEPEPSAS